MAGAEAMLLAVEQPAHLRRRLSTTSPSSSSSVHPVGACMEKLGVAVSDITLSE